MKFLGKIEELKKENEDRILLARCGVFMIAIGKDAIFLSEKFGFKKTCFKEGVCRVGVPLTYTLKYLELLEYRGYSYVVYDYDKNTKELTEKYRYNGSNKIEEIDFSCKYCDRYKEKNFIDIFEFLKMKEEEEKRKLMKNKKIEKNKEKNKEENNKENNLEKENS